MRQRLLVAKYTLADSYSRAARASKVWQHWHHTVQTPQNAGSISSHSHSNVKQLVLQYSLPKQEFASLQSPSKALSCPTAKSRFNSNQRDAASHQLSAQSATRLTVLDAQPANQHGTVAGERSAILHNSSHLTRCFLT